MFPIQARQAALRANTLFRGNKRANRYDDEWYTPDYIVEALGVFDMDPCAGPKRFAKLNISLPEDGLKCDWQGRVWLNPPYSTIEDWIKKFVAHRDGIILVNARPETQWFQYLARNASMILWLKGRLAFGHAGNMSKRATVGSVLVAYGQNNAIVISRSGLDGIQTIVVNSVL